MWSYQGNVFMSISVDVPSLYPPDPSLYLLTYLPMYRSLYLTCQSGTFLPPVFPLQVFVFSSLALAFSLPFFPFFYSPPIHYSSFLTLFHPYPLPLLLPIFPYFFPPSLQTHTLRCTSTKIHQIFRPYIHHTVHSQTDNSYTQTYS